jgi:hypothetical protein
MKKLMLLAGLYFLQPGLHAAPARINVKHDVAPISAHDRARIHFKENYAWVQDAAWYNTVNDGILCVFNQGNIVNRVFYDKLGYWQYTLLSYPSTDLPKSVEKNVLNNFKGYHISFVNEIRSDGQDPVYMINIENEDSIKVIAVNGEQIEVKQDLLKS